jgi:methylated-DNA-[protein]-cysteine S-methyltransferase
MEVLYRDSIETPLGQLHILATEHGVSHIRFSEQALQAEVIHANEVIEHCIQELREYFNGTRTEFSIPLAPSGTKFEISVWNNLMHVPYASTCSYLDIANHIKNPKAVRAVGKANGANPIAILIPCHRVVGVDGSLVGYSGELWRKRWLLDHEARVAGTILL